MFSDNEIPLFSGEAETPKWTRNLISKRIDLESSTEKHGIVAVYYQSSQQQECDVVEENVWDKLDDSTIEAILEYLTTSEVTSCLLVCKRWLKLILSSPTSNGQFNKKRSPWFLLSHNSSSTTGFIYDSDVSLWRQTGWSVPGDSSSISEKKSKLAPVAASAGVICFRYGSLFGTTSSACPLIVLNPLNRMTDNLPRLNIDPHLNIRGIAMHELKSNTSIGLGGSKYKIFALYGNWPNLGLKCFSMSDDFCDQEGSYYWKELPLTREIVVDESLSASNRALLWVQISMDTLVGLTTIGNEGQILVNFFYKSTGRLIRFDTQNGTYFMSHCLAPRCLFGRDMVKCDERVFMVGIEEPDSHVDDNNEFIQLKIWEIDMEKIELKPQSLICSEKYKFPRYSHLQVLYYIKPQRICCAGCGDYIMICLESNFTNDLNEVVMYNLKKNKWTVLPNHLKSQKMNGDFSLVVTSVYAFLPDIRALLK